MKKSHSKSGILNPRVLLAFTLCLAGVLTLFSAQFAAGDTGVNQATQADKAFAKYGLTGKGVIVAILDRGIDYAHPDFRNSNGTTRIKMMWDMSAQNLCDPANPAPVAYTESQINAALSSGAPLAERDAVGHGTVTAGIAAGNGQAVLPSSMQYAGMAPGADLVIVKVTSEGAPAHGTQPAENPFQGCFSQGLDLVIQEAATLGEPIVALINSGTQWGPIDGTSVVSQKIDSDFGLNNAGHVYVEASGDEGTLANHARATYSQTATVFSLSKSTTATDDLSAWYTGSVPANVTLTMSDNGATATVGPGNNCTSSVDGSITICQYLPGQQFYPWTSSGADRAVWINVIGHSGVGSLTFQATQNATGTADCYGDSAANFTYTNFLTPGRLSDYSSTFSAIVAACYNVRTNWTDINNNPESLTNEGATQALWSFSSGGPTRDGRIPPNGGVDITTPGGNLFAAYGLNTYWETFSFNLIEGGKGFYGRQSATSGASPVLAGAVALLLQMNPKLTASQIRQFIHQSAITDSFTGTAPNQDWGLGKLNVLGAADLVAAGFNTNPALSPTTLTFPPTPVNQTSAAQTVTFSNTGTATDALGVTSVATSGDFLITNTTCGTSLAVGANCTITISFKPSKTGTRTGALTIKDFNTHSPHIVTLTGTGTPAPIGPKADFNGDGKSDIVWQNTSTGERAIWLMNGASYSSGVSLGTVPTQWQIAGTGDFNGDGKTDILWQNTSTGDRAIWFMNGTTLASGIVFANVPIQWQIAGTGDFNSDGQTDILWQNTSTGDRAIWFMNGTALASGIVFANVPIQWQIAGTGDFNGDGKTDILWQNTSTGERAIWLMNGSTYSSGISLGTAPVQWEMRNH